MFLDHTQRRSTVGRTRPEESYRLCCVAVCDLETSRVGAAPYIYDISRLRVNNKKKAQKRLLRNEMTEVDKYCAGNVNS